MNSVFEKALLFLLFYTQKHTFIAHVFFSSKLLSLYHIPTFCGRALEQTYCKMTPVVALDDVTSFSRLKDVKIHGNVCDTVKLLAEFPQCESSKKLKT